MGYPDIFSWLLGWGWGVEQANYVQFHPIGFSANILTLKPPLLGNSIRMQGQGKMARSRGGRLHALTGGKEYYYQNLTFNNIYEDNSPLDGYATKDIVLAFLKACVGYQVDYTDQRGDIWRGLITTPNNPLVQHGTDKWGFSVDFEGVLYLEGAL